MRIGIYDPYLDDIGGGEKYMLTIAEVLSQKHDVSVFWDNEEDFKLVESRFGLSLEKVRVVENIFNIPLASKLSETKKYDAIIFLSDGSIPLSLSGKLFIHIQRPLDKISNGLMTKLKFKRVSKFFCNSNFTKNYIDNNLNIKSTVIYPPVSISSKNVRKENIILHVGRFRVVDKTIGEVKDYKKQYVMIDAFKKMSKKIPATWKLVMAVSVKDEDKAEFDSLVRKVRGYPIEFVINKTNEELWELYSQAKIYWHASGFGEDLDKNPEYAEHFGISTVEAMGGGAVPVVINAGGQAEIVEDGVSGFLWNSLSELESKTLTLMKDEKLLKKLSEKATSKSKSFSKERFTRDIYDLIKG